MNTTINDLEEGLAFAERYRLKRLLGRGGFSEVWLAEDEVAHVQVALKVYAPGSGLDESGLSMFTKEFQVVFDLNQTNLLRPTYFDSWQRMPYLILPYCKNGSALKFISGDAKITEDECWHILHDVAAGLAYLHGKNPPVIHQDIKADNILIGDNGVYMITDFGISARVRSTLRKNQAEEQSGGTLAYMGPERFSKNPTPIMASDIWSLGAMMFELMTGGNPPFGNHGGMLQKNGAEIPEIQEPFSRELKDIVYACLALNTWERPDAAAIEEMTYDHIRGNSTSFSGSLMKSNGSRIKFSAKYVRLALGVVAGILAIVLGWWLFSNRSESQLADATELAKLRNDSIKQEEFSYRLEECKVAWDTLNSHRKAELSSDTKVKLLIASDTTTIDGGLIDLLHYLRDMEANCQEDSILYSYKDNVNELKDSVTTRLKYFGSKLPDLMDGLDEEYTDKIQKRIDNIEKALDSK